MLSYREAYEKGLEDGKKIGLDFFTKELKRCKRIFKKHNKTKGDSWKTCNIKILQEKLIEEFNEWYITKTDINELADIINVALMLMAREIQYFKKGIMI